MKLNISPIKGINQNDFFFHSYPVSILNFGIYLERNSVFYQVLHLNKFDILKLSLNESELIVAI